MDARSYYDPSHSVTEYGGGQVNPAFSQMQAMLGPQVQQQPYIPMSGAYDLAMRTTVQPQQQRQISFRPESQGHQDPMAGEMAYQRARAMELANNGEEAQQQAMAGPMPTRMVHGAGIMSGRVSDPMAMNAYQRRAFLPGSSNAQYMPEPQGAMREAMGGRQQQPQQQQQGNDEDTVWSNFKKTISPPDRKIPTDRQQGGANAFYGRG